MCAFPSFKRFERVWRGLKGRADLFAQYVGSFKKSTFKKVLKEALSPDLISFMWRSLRDHPPNQQAQLKVLEGFSSVPSFPLMLSLLPIEDIACIGDILAQLGEAATESGSPGEDMMGKIRLLRQVYNIV